MLAGAGADCGDALLRAIRGGHRELLMGDVLHNGAFVNSADAGGWTLLHLAAMKRRCGDGAADDDAQRGRQRREGVLRAIVGYL